MKAFSHPEISFSFLQYLPDLHIQWALSPTTKHFGLTHSRSLLWLWHSSASHHLCSDHQDKCQQHRTDLIKPSTIPYCPEDKLWSFQYTCFQLILPKCRASDLYPDFLASHQDLLISRRLCYKHLSFRLAPHHSHLLPLASTFCLPGRSFLYACELLLHPKPDARLNQRCLCKLLKWAMQREENNRMGKTRDLLKKNGDTKGAFHAKKGTIKDRNRKDQIEAGD